MANIALLAYALASPSLVPSDQQAWERIQRSVLTLSAPIGGRAGVAALIDSTGLFLADRSCVTGPSMIGRTHQGLAIALDLVGVDDATQLALLRARVWTETDRPAVVVARPTDVRGRPVIAVLPSGPIRGEVVAEERVGVLRPALRYLPLSEIRFETTQGRTGGALAFTLDGKLAGVVSATLEAYTRPEEHPRGLAWPAAPRVRTGQFGPVGLTVGYALGVEVLDRVVEGFRSPSRKPQHPYIGAFFRDAAEGALVERVVEGSPSARGGLREGDVILRLDDSGIEDALDLASALFRLRVGQEIRLFVRRGMDRQLRVVIIRVGTQ